MAGAPLQHREPMWAGLTAADARRIEAAYRRGKHREQQIRPGVFETSGALDPGGFSFECCIQRSGGEVSVSWQEA
ncbi:hypothetical protein [Lysobacter sp. CA199]|uniref:hypothetical protein n=1 Tax=Lysobacter sp. CA199 TaxID=3455608 RepID=UPI003F8D0F46